MKRAPLLLMFIFLLLTQTVIAQKSPIKFGEVSLDEIRMSSYPEDSSANAVVLSEFGKAYISITNVSASLYFEKHVRIKILKNEGSYLSNQEISVLRLGANAEERVVNLKASSYNLVNGKIEEAKMNKDAIFKEKFNKNTNLLKFSIPNVKPGSVIEYSYTLQSDFLPNFPNWQFQHEIPTMHSEYYAIIPEFFIMEKYAQGYITPTSYEPKQKTQGSYFETVHHWIYKKVPAFKPEPYMTTLNDYITKINFALAFVNFPGEPQREVMGSWEKLIANLKESEGFSKAIKGSGFLKKTVEQIITGKTTDLEKATAIHDYVKNTLEWDGQEDFYADNLKEVLEKKKGTVGDINILLAAMLDKAGLNPDMILLSTRDHGFIRQMYPMSRQFNYVVCRLGIGDSFIYLDATEKFIPINVLPERCLNGEGLLVSDFNKGWVTLQTKTKSKKVVNIDVNLQSIENPTGTLTKISDGYLGHSARRLHKKLGQEEYSKLVTTKLNLEVEGVTIEDLETYDKPVKEIFKVNVTDALTINDDIIYIDPLFGQQVKENPFKQEKREYPVDYGSQQEEIYMVKILVPEGYIAEELPQSKVFVLPDKSGRFTYNVQVNGNSINVFSNLQINRTLYVGDEYAGLKVFYAHIIAKQNEQIVLKKK
ncbi:MAG: DUF3857 and transglutaminase domain-containing protein [Cyclobacteriaceae bacterium]|jgi:hypothetical protein|nr:DUF3857 and transglutaminase domain-containing protein [Cyclobacteriaceae bacterium]